MKSNLEHNFVNINEVVKTIIENKRHLCGACVKGRFAFGYELDRITTKRAELKIKYGTSKTY